MAKILLSELKQQTGIGFGTSGIRGLVTDLSDKVIYCYTKAFAEYLKEIDDVKNGKIAIAGDLRESTDRILKTVARTVKDCGLEIVYCGNIPTSALVYFGVQNGIPSIMVTGSHIPADRNGIKYNLSTREILKKDEQAITAKSVDFEDTDYNFELPDVNSDAEKLYLERFIKRFSNNCLLNKKIGVYQHSAVGRDILVKILTLLGAKVTELERSDYFIPIDTELIDEDLVNKGKSWSQNYGFDAIVSTDGDSDRPLIADENGVWLRTDILGVLVAKYFEADAVVTAVSCNSVVDKVGWFKKVDRVKIGSPYTIEGILNIKNDYKKVIGYEANGGFIETDLLTRDAIVVIVAIIAMSKEGKVSDLILQLPKRYTASGSVKGFPTEKSLRLVTTEKAKTINVIESTFGQIESINELDGLRFYLKNGDIVHLRPSMNSPEFRDYTESDSETKAIELSNKAIDLIKSWL